MVQISGHIKQNKYKTELSNGRHQIISDEPVESGGLDLGFSPTELLSSALAACTSITLRMYADRKEWPLTEVKVNVTLERDKENNITNINRDIDLIGNLNDDQRQRLLDVANKCPVHHILTNPVNIDSKLKIDEANKNIS